MDVTMLQSNYKGLSSFGFAALQGLATKKDAKALFNRIDVDGSGFVTLEDWCEFIKYMEVPGSTVLGQMLATHQLHVEVSKWAIGPHSSVKSDVVREVDSESNTVVAEDRGRTAASRRAEEEAIREEKIAAREAAAANKTRLKMPLSAKTNKKKIIARSASAPRGSAGAVSKGDLTALSGGQSASVVESSPETTAAPEKGSSVSVDRAGMRGDSMHSQRLNEGTARNVAPLQPTVGQESDQNTDGGPVGEIDLVSEQSPMKLRMEDEAIEHLTRECREGRQHLLDVLQLMDLSTTVKYAPPQQPTISKPKPLDKVQAASQSSENHLKRKGRDLAAAKIRSLTDEVEYLKAELAARETIGKHSSSASTRVAAETNTSRFIVSDDLSPQPRPGLLVDNQEATLGPRMHLQEVSAGADVGAEAEAWAAEAAIALLREAALGTTHAQPTPPPAPLLLTASEPLIDNDDEALAWAAAAAENLRDEHRVLGTKEPLDGTFASKNSTENPLVEDSFHFASLQNVVESRHERKSYEDAAITNHSPAMNALYQVVKASKQEAALGLPSRLQEQPANEDGGTEAEVWAAEAANALLREATLGSSHSQFTAPPAPPGLPASESRVDGDALAWAAAAAENLQNGHQALTTEQAASIALANKNSIGNPLNEGSLNSAALQKSPEGHQEQGIVQGGDVTNAIPPVDSLFIGGERSAERKSSRPGRAELLEVLQLLDWDEATSPDFEVGSQRHLP